MSAKPRYDVVIVGGGQAGDPLAHALAKSGRRVALAERKQLGGSCVNFGCTPTKAALASAKRAAQARRAAEFGLRIPVVEVDYAAVLRRARDIAAVSRARHERGFAGVENPALLRGHGRFTGREGNAFALMVGDLGVVADQVVLDTGTRTRIPPLPGLETIAFLHAGNWLDREDRPEHVVMLGGGVIALEMGQLYARLGIRVTLIERSDRIGGREDPDVAEALEQALVADGVAIRTRTIVERVRQAGQGVELTLAAGAETLSASHLFVATGRRPNTDDLGLDTIGLEPDAHGVLAVDERLATRVAGVWAAGDIRGGPQFTHTAWDDYRILVSQLLRDGGDAGDAGDAARTTRRIVPYAIFTDPELGRVGMTEDAARASGRDFEVKRFDMAKNGRAYEQGATAGFIKVIVERGTHQILGAAVLCESGAELVHLYVDLMNAGAPATVIRDAVHIHPTLAEAVQSAVS